MTDSFSSRGDGAAPPSVYQQESYFMRWVSARERPHGAVRYRCPVTGSFVLVTEPEQLARLQRPRTRLRCVCCAETHLLTRDDDQESSVTVTSAPLSIS